MQCHPQHYDAVVGLDARVRVGRSGVRRDEQARPARRRSSGRSACSATRRWRSRSADPTARDFDPSTLPPEANAASPATSATTSTRSTADHNNGLVLALDQTMRGGAKIPADTPRTTRCTTRTDGRRVEQVDDVRLVPRRHHAGAASRSSARIRSGRPRSSPRQPDARRAADLQRVPHDLVDRRDRRGRGLNVGSRTTAFTITRCPRSIRRSRRSRTWTRRRRASRPILDGAITIVGPTPVAGPPAPGGICLDPPGTLSVRTDNITARSHVPSGAAQDRRVWVEVIAYDASGTKIFSSGEVGDTRIRKTSTIRARLRESAGPVQRVLGSDDEGRRHARALLLGRRERADRS